MSTNRRHILTVKFDIERVNPEEIANTDRNKSLRILRSISFWIMMISLVVLGINYDWVYRRSTGHNIVELPLWYFSIPVATGIVFAISMWLLKRESRISN